MRGDEPRTDNCGGLCDLWHYLFEYIAYYFFLSFDFPVCETVDHDLSLGGYSQDTELKMTSTIECSINAGSSIFVFSVVL